MACAAFLSTCPSRFSSLGANHSINQVCFRYPRYRRRTRAGRSIHVQLQKEGMSERHYLPASPESRPAHHSVTAAIASAAATVTFMLPSQEAAAISPAAAVAGPLFAPLNAETPELLRALVWLDFRVAVALFVVSPLVLFLWSLVDNDSETDAVKRTLIGYWQASSLLMITVFLNIANVSVASFTGLFVQALIPITLIWWQDLAEEIALDESALARAFRAWRGPAIVAAAIGVVLQIPFQECNISANPMANPICSAWLEPPYRFHELLLSGVPSDALFALAATGGTIYAVYLAWLSLVVVPRVGREGRKDRNCFSSVSALKWIGLISKESPGN